MLARAIVKAQRPEVPPWNAGSTSGVGCYHAPRCSLETLAAAAPQVVLIAVAAVAAYVAIRIAVAAAVRHLIARRTNDASAGNLARVELERRVTTLGQPGRRIAGR